MPVAATPLPIPAVRRRSQVVPLNTKPYAGFVRPVALLFAQCVIVLLLASAWADVALFAATTTAPLSVCHVATASPFVETAVGVAELARPPLSSGLAVTGTSLATLP